MTLMMVTEKIIHVFMYFFCKEVDVLTEVNIYIRSSGVNANLGDMYQCFGKIYCLYLQSRINTICNMKMETVN
jgi:hypothetical protein